MYGPAAATSRPIPVTPADQRRPTEHLHALPRPAPSCTSSDPTPCRGSPPAIAIVAEPRTEPIRLALGASTGSHRHGSRRCTRAGCAVTRRFVGSTRFSFARRGSKSGAERRGSPTRLAAISTILPSRPPMTPWSRSWPSSITSAVTASSPPGHAASRSSRRRPRSAGAWGAAASFRWSSSSSMRGCGPRTGTHRMSVALPGSLPGRWLA